MDKEKLESIVRKSVEDVWYNRRSLNPVEEQTKALTDVIWSELEQKLNLSGIGSKRPQFTLEEITEAIKTQWVKDFGKLMDDDSERDGYFICGFVHEALKAACASGAGDKSVSGGVWCECGIPNRNTTSSQCGTCFKPIAGSSAGRF